MFIPGDHCDLCGQARQQDAGPEVQQHHPCVPALRRYKIWKPPPRGGGTIARQGDTGKKRRDPNFQQGTQSIDLIN